MNPFFAGLAFGLVFLGGSQVRQFERDAAKEIRTKLSGPEARVSVQADVGPEAIFGDVHGAVIRASNFSTDGLPLFTEPHRSTRGILRSLRIELESFDLNGLHVLRLSSSIPDCRFDLGLALRHHKIRLTRSGVGEGEVEIAQDDLAKFILRKFHEIKRVTVRIDRGKAYVVGYGEFVIFKTDFSVVADLVPIGGSKIGLANATILLGGRRTDPDSEKILMDTLNPVVDLDRDLKLYGAVDVKEVILSDGILKARGATRIPDDPLGRP